MMIGTVLGIGIATTGGAIAGYQYLKEPDFAEVVNSQPMTKDIKVPREECRDVTVTQQNPVQDKNRITGKVIGATIGGVLGHQVGGGNGKKAATVAGAIAGGYAGDRVQDNMQKKDTYTTTEKRCSTVYDTREEITGYRVTYRLNGKESVIELPQDPGQRIPVQNGQLVLSPQDTHTQIR
ncbi:glycine zipper 2TM domain-containing protein [Cellvibrio japonicus]